jgi:hypothetical protein
MGLSCSVIYWVPETLSSDIKRSGLEPNYSLLSIVQILVLQYAFMRCRGQILFLNMLQRQVMASELLTKSVRHWPKH